MRRYARPPVHENFAYDVARRMENTGYSPLKICVDYELGASSADRMVFSLSVEDDISGSAPLKAPAVLISRQGVRGRTNRMGREIRSLLERYFEKKGVHLRVDRNKGESGRKGGKYRCVLDVSLDEGQAIPPSEPCFPLTRTLPTQTRLF